MSGTESTGCARVSSTARPRWTTTSGANETLMLLPSPLSRRGRILSRCPLRKLDLRHDGSFSSFCCGDWVRICCCWFICCCRRGRAGLAPTSRLTSAANCSSFITISFNPRDAPIWRPPSTLHLIVSAPPLIPPCHTLLHFLFLLLLFESTASGRDSFKSKSSPFVTI